MSEKYVPLCRACLCGANPAVLASDWS